MGGTQDPMAPQQPAPQPPATPAPAASSDTRRPVATARAERDQAVGEATNLRTQLAARTAELDAAQREVQHLTVLVAHGQTQAGRP